MIGKEAIRKEVLNELAHGKTPTDEDIYREIDRAILRNNKTSYGTIHEMHCLREQIFQSIRGLDLLEPYLKDDSVTEIMVVGHRKIFIEQHGSVRKVSDRFIDEEEVYRLIEQIVSPTNRIVNASSPIVDSRLKDGSRVHIVLPPVSLVGPVITIRKFPKEGMTMDKLIGYEAFPKELAGILACLVRSRYNILISGATNSGKSSLLNSLAEYIPAGERIIVIEDSAELQFYQVDNLVRLETRNENMEGKHEISMNDLIKASLRMRPDRIIVGEVRGAEAVSMLQALSTGHSGSFSTIHANSCADALRRLETMVLMGMDLPLRAIRGQIASAVDILIHLGRTADGKRRLLEMSEVSGDGENYEVRPLFQWEKGRLVMKESLLQTGKLADYRQYETYQKLEAAFH